MIKHEDKKYNYKDALELKYPEKDAVAKQHNAKKTSMNLVFDSVEDAGAFSKEVLQKIEKGKVFKAEESFLYPRPGDKLPHDYSDNMCIIL